MTSRALYILVLACIQSVSSALETVPPSPAFTVEVVPGRTQDESWLVSIEQEQKSRVLLLNHGPDLERRLSYEVETSPGKSSIIVVESSRHNFFVYLVSKDRNGKWRIAAKYDPSTIATHELKRVHKLSKNESVVEPSLSNCSWSDDAHISIDFGATI